MDTWPIGKHKGKPLKDIDKQYLEWVAENMDKQELVGAAKDELARREKAANPPAPKPNGEPDWDSINQKKRDDIAWFNALKCATWMFAGRWGEFSTQEFKDFVAFLLDLNPQKLKIPNEK